MGRRTRALEDLVVRERTDDKEGDDERLSATTPARGHAYSLGCGPLVPAFCLLDEGIGRDKKSTWIPALQSRLSNAVTLGSWRECPGVRPGLKRSRDLCHPYGVNSLDN